jgi:hypothetical protein
MCRWLGLEALRSTRLYPSRFANQVKLQQSITHRFERRCSNLCFPCFLVGWFLGSKPPCMCVVSKCTRHTPPTETICVINIQSPSVVLLYSSTSLQYRTGEIVRGFCESASPILFQCSPCSTEFTDFGHREGARQPRLIQ